MNSEVELKKCPLCGRKAMIITKKIKSETVPGLYSFFTTVKCMGKSGNKEDDENRGCNARVTSVGGEEYTAKMWNRRMNNDRT